MKIRFNVIIQLYDKLQQTYMNNQIHNQTPKPKCDDTVQKDSRIDKVKVKVKVLCEMMLVFACFDYCSTSTRRTNSPNLYLKTTNYNLLYELALAETTKSIIYTSV